MPKLCIAVEQKLRKIYSTFNELNIIGFVTYLELAHNFVYLFKNPVIRVFMKRLGISDKNSSVTTSTFYNLRLSDAYLIYIYKLNSNTNM